jgi:hypothetical protein
MLVLPRGSALLISAELTEGRNNARQAQGDRRALAPKNASHHRL